MPGSPALVSKLDVARLGMEAPSSAVSCLRKRGPDSARVALKRCTAAFMEAAVAQISMSAPGAATSFPAANSTRSAATSRSDLSLESAVRASSIIARVRPPSSRVSRILSASGNSSRCGRRRRSMKSHSSWITSRGPIPSSASLPSIFQRDRAWYHGLKLARNSRARWTCGPGFAPEESQSASARRLWITTSGVPQKRLSRAPTYQKELPMERRFAA